MFTARSLLFVPGHRPDRFEKALDSGADLVCIDLEDAVPLAQKGDARTAVCGFLERCEPALLERIVVRVSAASSDEGRADLYALLHARLPARLMLAKTENAEEIAEASSLLGQPVRWIALIESASGLLGMERICRDCSLDAVMFGGGDFAAQVGAEFAWEPLLWARSQMAVIAAAYRLPVIDVPFLDVRDVQGLEAETRRVSALGFSAKAAIHPSQIEGIHRGFAPTADALNQAQKIVRAFEQAQGGAVVVEGRMVDQPIVDSARKLIARVRTEKEFV
ncbi:HpcH/HpaI aldolase/citrate lyase family protein [Microbulbifer pacificus]|uniref:CoA ester lyase n=1 Tax=Microbulbifer pacificus TaxID=407164 RepID=A0AAU0N0U7_9GAMM|nr:CoA ester lyase [Microbulbifer pacificus]WOX05878.1 CoA ester lyase [Microbulbifer pacificus]